MVRNWGRLLFISTLVWVALTGSQSPRIRRALLCELPHSGVGSLQSVENQDLPVWQPGGIRLDRVEAFSRSVATDTPPVQHAEVVQTSTGSDLIFTHVASGVSEAGNIRIETALVFVNTSNRPSDLTVSFFKEDGSPMEVEIGEVRASQFSFPLHRGWTERLKTSGEGPIQVGWARVHMTQPVSGTATFTVSDLAGKIGSEVGISSSDPMSAQALFVEYGPSAKTGMAIVNPDLQGGANVELILRDLAGVEIQRVTLILEAGGKRSKFISEYLSGLDPTGFLGVLEIRSTNPVAVLTLLQRGRHMTSLPAVREYTSEEIPAQLSFYRVGVGQLGKANVSTSFYVINNSDNAAQVALALFGLDGEALQVEVAGETDDLFNFSVPARGAVKLTASGDSEIKLGWGSLTSDQAVGAAATITQYAAATGAKSAGGLAFQSEVGVEAVIPHNRFSVFADTMDSRGTAIALSNFLGEESQEVWLELRSKTNLFLRRASVVLGPHQHVAKFITELFPDDFQEPFEGRIEVSGKQVVGGTLRLAGSLMTSFPTMLPLHGFKPMAVTTLFSTLGGTAPAASFGLYHYAGDMTLETIDIRSDQIGFDKSAFESEGSWVLSGDTGTSQSSTISAIGSLESLEPDGSVRVRLDTIMDDRLSPLGTISLSGTPEGGLRALIELDNRLPRTYAYSDFFLEIRLPCGVLVLPEEGSTALVRTALTSVSTSRRVDRRFAEENSQEIYLRDFPDQAPRLILATPFSGRSQGPMFIVGENLGSPEGLEVLFTRSSSWKQEWTEAEVLKREGDILLVKIPDGAQSGPIMLRQDGARSNEYLFRMVFGPIQEFDLATMSEQLLNFSAGISQFQGELMFLNWQMVLDGVSLELTKAAVGEVVMTGSLTRSYGPTPIEFAVESVEAEVLTVFDPYSEFRFRFYEISSEAGSGRVVVENVPEEEPLTPQLLDQHFSLKLESVVPLLQKSGGAAAGVTVTTIATSVRASVGEHSKYKNYGHFQFN